MNAQRWDVEALKAGALVSLAFAVPLSIAARWANSRSDDSELALLLSIGAALGFIVGSGCAAWVQQRDLPLTHGLATSIATYAAAQGAFMVIKLLRNADVNWFAAFFNLTVVVGCGLIGGMLGGRLRAKGFHPKSFLPTETEKF